MDSKMFCFQCEQTAGGTGCQGCAGVCGKSYEVAGLQDELTGALIGLAKTSEKNGSHEAGTYRLLIKGLFTTITNVNFNEETLKIQIDEVHAEKAKISAIGEPDYNMKDLWNADEDIRSLKSLILFGIRGMAAYAYHAGVLGYTSDEVNQFFVKALCAIGENHTMDELLPIVMEVGQVNYKCM